MNLKMLVRSIDKLIDLFGSLKNSAKSSHDLSAFSGALIKLKKIRVLVIEGDLGAAATEWRALQYYCSDSVPMQEGFLSQYMPLRQSIINHGLQ